MLYKNKIKVQNILKSAVALMLMLTLSLSTALSPLAKAEEAKYMWKTLTSVPRIDGAGKVYVSPDGSKLFILGGEVPLITQTYGCPQTMGLLGEKYFRSRYCSLAH